LFCHDGKAGAASAQSFTLWQQATIEIERRDHFESMVASSNSMVACLRHVHSILHMCAILCAHPARYVHSTPRRPWGCNSMKKELKSLCSKNVCLEKVTILIQIFFSCLSCFWNEIEIAGSAAPYYCIYSIASYSSGQVCRTVNTAYGWKI